MAMLLNAMQNLAILMLAGSFFLCSSNGEIYLELDSDYSPPATIPTDAKDLIYSAPAMDHMLEPIKVYIKYTSNNTYVSDSISVTATTILTSNQYTEGNPGDWYDGEICEHSFWYNQFSYNRYYLDNGMELHCNTSDARFPLGKVEHEAINGTAEFPRLLHTKYFNETRRITFYVTYNGAEYNVSTNPIHIHMQAAGINITSVIPLTLFVNEPLNITVQTLAQDPDDSSSLIPLTEGRHSALNMDLTIAWSFKRFYILFPPSSNFQELYSSDITLEGKGAQENGQYDVVIRKRAEYGEVTFEDIRILDVHSSVVINITQLLPYDPWERWPPQYNDTIVQQNGLYFYTNDSSNSPAVALTPEINVTAPEIAKLEIDSSSLESFGENIDANFPMKPDMIVNALSSSGEVITDGPDSELTIYAELEPDSACLSSDHAFQLVRGTGVFPGSVCRPSNNVKLRFNATAANGSVLYSDWTPDFNITGNLRVGGIFPKYYESGLAILYEAAAYLINEGFYSQDFIDQGRTFMNEYFISNEGTVSETLNIYEGIFDRNTDAAKTSVRAIIGSVGNKQTIELSTVSKQHGMAIVGYNADDAELADKSTHPYFNRVSIAQERKFYGMGLFLSTLQWKRIIVIRDSNTPIPPIMYEKFETHGIEINLEIIVPAAGNSTNFEGLRPLDDDAIHILHAGTKIIFSYTSPPNDLYLYYEAIRLEFAPIHGYQWFTEYSSLLGFPFNDQAGNCSQTPTCTAAFNSTIVINPGSKVDLSKGFWSETLFDAYTHLDPTAIPGSPVYRLPSLLNFHSLSHDAAVAVFLGAMRIINRNETITGPDLATEIREVSFIGGSGRVWFDENGDRPEYSATIYQMKPLWEDITFSSDFIFTAGYYFINSATNEATLTFTRERSLSTGTVPDFMSFTSSDSFNNITIQGYYDGSDELMTFHLLVPAAFYCIFGCGGGLADDANGSVLYYNNGECIGQNICMCKTINGTNDLAYAGLSCEFAVCIPNCIFGECTSPGNCTCNEGWGGSICKTPLCEPPCEAGVCNRPNVCTCDDGYYGPTCTGVCSCDHGECSEGSDGTGTCTCESGYAGAECTISIPLTVIPTGSFTIFIFIIIVILIVWYVQKKRQQAALTNDDWVVVFDDVVIHGDYKALTSSSFRSMSSIRSQTNQLKSKEGVEDVSHCLGTWKNTAVAIKRIKKDVSIPLTKSLRKEIKEMREIRHNNLANFIGACHEAPNICILMELAPKGSLEDLLANKAYNLDWNFKYSLLKDICKGMIYLSETSFKSHGRLKPSNCVVDNRWTLKITDYGMSIFKSNQTDVPQFTGIKAPLPEATPHVEEVLEEGLVTATSIKRALLYTAPEILSTGVTHPDHVGLGTLEGDVYSFSLIMYAILTSEANAYNEYTKYMEINDLLECLAGFKPVPESILYNNRRHSTCDYLRPTPPSDEESAGYVELMRRCWSQNPKDRPSFQSILKQLNHLHANPTGSDLMDNLVKMLEQYSTNLEGIVAERTASLHAEKEKMENLICRMLPKAIAEQLQQGQQVEAESFDSVTIYFSDIVGFTEIASISTPLQVVGLLNDLYTCFDAVIDNFDVYKVETIGDAYMVVSGLPIRNGDDHAGEIASMALHLLSAIVDFKIHHLPEKKLQLRAGMHSGPCVAGVVGLKMPRYCLFGDTVNTASRMESGGLALRIHVSKSTADILNRLGGYHLELRGERDVKGKGVMTTYWLKGKEGFTKSLPSQDIAVSASEHEFK